MKIYVFVIVGGAALVPLIFYLVGFAPVIAKGALSRFCQASRSALLKKKPSEGTLAAKWHSSIGNAVAGSIFSILQSLGTKPLLQAGIGAVIGAVGCVIHYVWEGFWDEDQDGEPPAYFEK